VTSATGEAEPSPCAVSRGSRCARLAEERLETAAVVYGLSPSQVRLAEQIIGGQSLGDAAERLKVSVATTRTQLQRMFDKTGVRSQPALVRALLSVAAPCLNGSLPEARCAHLQPRSPSVMAPLGRVNRNANSSS
jgi:DNA-binding CsgD family transcriptional regulator